MAATTRRERNHHFLRLLPPRWAFSSFGLCPHQGSFSEKSGCHDHVLASRTSCRTAAASPRILPGNARAHINQVSCHGVIRVPPSVCAAMLRALVMENFLSRTGDGLFVR